jgi:diguanylate cyclase (GGDEF)-like protein
MPAENNRLRRVLVVDDDISNLKLMVEALVLQKKYQVEQASSGAEALKKIQDGHPELILLDYSMPGMNGLETLKMLRSSKDYTAVIFCSANTEEDLVVECLKAGADDYIRKPFRFSELQSRVEVRFRIKDLNDELQIANQKLQELAIRDDLTGLYNMRPMYDKIEHELRRAKRFGRQVACIMMDIDHFKEVNDKADHLFGSFVIKELGKLINATMRETDFAARYGGDEFLIVLCETNDDGARIFTERLREKIEKHVFKDGKYSLQRTCSFGLSLTNEKSSLDPKEIVRLADHALYESKKKGRNQVSG